VVIYILFFIFGVMFDVLAVLWTYFNTSKHRKAIHGAALVSAAIGVLNTISVVQVVWNYWLLVPEVIGMILGTYLGFWLKKKLKDRANDGDEKLKE